MEGECLGVGRDAIQRGFPRMGHGFVLLTGGASLDVVCYPLSHPRPLGALPCLSKGLVSAGVSGGRMVMVDGHQGTFFEE